MAAIARLAQAPELLQAIYPEQTSGAANASLVEVPPSWKRSDVLLSIPPGWWHIKIETTSGAQSRFYTNTNEWIIYDGKLDAIIALKPGTTQRFWGNMAGVTLSGKEITAVMQYIKPL
ncbi:hypothetical protein [Corynebacterium stationis]|uniref:hypothetical protein n=1 Tax=Corynebacterium stationis TaxID=1705 RepID=UPI00076F8F86|nr:hypothetical protein [Corynebacterium stationis]AMJ43696.1 hypothetical protein AW169_01290 [Corynebacterium stationis]AQX70142.1 hypothetical protein CA21670_00415 [Corynebacterium stationis]ASJ17846.1 hypothetical protein BA700_01290 [Corynebacterium stationis]HJG64041.1 hypothetical protein [Corynebacterium stationis]